MLVTNYMLLLLHNLEGSLLFVCLFLQDVRSKTASLWSYTNMRVSLFETNLN